MASKGGLSVARLQKVQGYVNHAVDTLGLPCAFAGVTRAGSNPFLYRAGLQNDGKKGIPGKSGSLTENPKALKEDTIFKIYSMSKPITSVALLALIEEGRCLLHQPAWLFLGRKWHKKNMRVWVRGHPSTGDMETEPCKRSITLRDLFTHTSGISYGPGLRGASAVDASYAAHFKGNWMKRTSLEEFCDQLAEQPLLFQPGTHWHYGYNTDVLGRIVEVLEGTNLEEALRRRIFAPLKMVDTSFRVPEEKVHRFADCYVDMPDGRMVNLSAHRSHNAEYFKAGGPTFLSGGGGLVSTMRDYLRFCDMIVAGGELDGQRVLSRKTIEWMSSNHLPGGKTIEELLLPTEEGYTEVGGPGVGFGLGFAVRTAVHGDAGANVGSVGNISWGGLAGTRFWIDFEERMAVVFMTQVIDLNPHRATPQETLQAMVYGAITDGIPLKSRL